MGSTCARDVLRWIALLGFALSAIAARAGGSASFELEGSIEFSKDSSQYLLAYSSNETDGGPDIWARLLNLDGSPAGADYRLSTQKGKMTKPVIAYGASSHRYLVLWGRKVEGSAQIVGATVGLDGKVIGSEFLVSHSDLYDQRASVAYCPGRDRFLVTWTRGTRYNFDKGVSDIWGQFVGGDAAQMQGTNFLIASAENNQFKSDVDCDTVNDRFLVVWEDQRNEATQDDIYGQIISSDGTMLNGNFLISGTPDVERRPVVAANKDGTHLVVWESDSDSSSDLYSTTIDSNGRLLRDPVPIGSGLGGGRDRPSVAYSRQQDVYLVVFHNSAIGELSDGIYGQFVNNDGKPRQTAFPLTTAQLGQYRPNVRAANYTFLAVWTDYRDTKSKGKKDHVYEYFGRVIGNDMPLSARWKNPDSK
jgi:hypothetical protein